MEGGPRTFPFHFEARAVVHAAADALFARLDDPNLLSAHMTQSSLMMAGSRMSIELDTANGRAIGAVIRMSGRFMGIPLSLEETVTERVPPRRKVWETTGTPKLVVIGSYRMGYDIVPQGPSSELRVFIDYALPKGLGGHWLGRIFGLLYARWCTQRVARDAAEYFGPSSRP
jgi:hypothetical protein